MAVPTSLRRTHTLRHAGSYSLLCFVTQRYSRSYSTEKTRTRSARPLSIGLSKCGSSAPTSRTSRLKVTRKVSTASTTTRAETSPTWSPVPTIDSWRFGTTRTKHASKRWTDTHKTSLPSAITRRSRLSCPARKTGRFESGTQTHTGLKTP